MYALHSMHIFCMHGKHLNKYFFLHVEYTTEHCEEYYIPEFSVLHLKQLKRNDDLVN